MGCCDFSINYPQNSCLVTWLLKWNITFWVKYSIKKLSDCVRTIFETKMPFQQDFFFCWDLGGKSHNVRCSINYRPILFYPRKEFQLDFIGETRPPLLCQKHPRIADFIPWFLRHRTLWSINKILIWILSHFRACTKIKCHFSIPKLWVMYLCDLEPFWTKLLWKLVFDP